MRKAFKYRLYPSEKQDEKLSETLRLCRHLYNAALQERKEAWEKNRISISFKGQSNQLPVIKIDCPEYEGVYSQVSQDVLHRADKAFKAFFRRLKRGEEKPGYPRFKSRDRYDSFIYPQTGFMVQDNRLQLSKIGSIKIKLHRPVEGYIKTLNIKREAGKWYAVFSVIAEPKPLPHSDKAVGIDMGLESFLVTSDEEFVDNPRFLRTAEDKLAEAQRTMDRRKKGGKRRAKAKRIVSVCHARIRNARLDFHHKIARNLVNTYGFIALEDLNIKGMVKNHCLAKSISDAGWGQFISIVQAKAEEAGREVVLVNPRNTSQICSGCGALVKKDLSMRWHNCPVCDLSLHRDINSSCNTLALGLSVRGSTPRSPRL